MNYQADFADFEEVTYFNAAAQGPLPRTSAIAAQIALAWKERPDRLPEDLYLGLPDRVRALIATLIGGASQDVAITTGATSGLIAVALGLDFIEGDEVLVSDGEFPSHFAVFLPLQDRLGVRVKLVVPQNRFIDATDFIRELGARTRLVSTSLVRHDDAALIDAHRLARACHEIGAYLLLDVSQCAGAMALDVRSLDADFLVGVGYKWLLSPFGTGFFWIRDDLIPRMRPVPSYWTGFDGAEQFQLIARRFSSLSAGKLELTHNARRWDSPGTASFTNLAAMEASLKYLLRIGTANVWNHNQQMISQIMNHLPAGFVLTSPKNAGPFLCVAADNISETQRWHKKLADERVIVSLREGALRIAPHLYNSETDVDRLLSVLSSR